MTASQVFGLEGRRVFVAGAGGMVGGAVAKRLETEGCEAILVPRRADLDLQRQSEVEDWMNEQRPDVVIVAAAKVGGIHANDTYPADFLYENLIIEANVIHAAFRADVKKLLFLGSSCIYPKLAPQPIPEDALLTGPLEPTNEWYAVAKIAGIKLCQAYRRQHGSDFISAMPSNLYGPGDNFDPENSHVLPALIRKAVEAKERGEKGLSIWGTGAPRREFLHVSDCADALVFLIKHYSGDEHVNVGFGSDMTILELAKLVMKTVRLAGDVQTDPSKPDGTPRKLMSSDKLQSMGWLPSIDVAKGIEDTVAWFLENRDTVRVSG